MATARAKAPSKVATTDSAKEARESRARYSRALSALREKHADEFTALLAAEWAKDGEVYVPRLSPQEREERERQAKAAKAKAKIEKLRAEFPELFDVEDEAAQIDGQTVIDE